MEMWRLLKENVPRWWPGPRISAAAVHITILLQQLTAPNPDPVNQLMVAVCVVWILHLLRIVLGPIRRYSDHWFVQYDCMAAYCLPLPLFIYALQTALPSPEFMKKENLGFCCILFLVYYFSVLDIPAYSLSDNNPVADWRFLKFITIIFWFMLPRPGPPIDRSTIRLAAIFGVMFLDFCHYLSKRLPPAVLAYVKKPVADYMNSGSSPLFVPGAPINIQSCNYPFIEIDQQQAGIKDLLMDFNINNPSMGTHLHWIRVRDVLECAVPDTMDMPRFQDSCLSYSFFQLLTRRYLGFACAEEGDENVKDFMLGMLQTDYEGAFKMVEVQLAFLHDYFFTENFILIMHGTKSYNGKSVLDYIAPTCILPSLVFLLGMGQRKQLSGFVICAELLTTILAAQLYAFVRFLPFLTSDWCAARQCYWKGTVGQYSLMEDYDRHYGKKAFVSWLKEKLFSEWSGPFIKHYPVEEGAVKLPDSVRKSVALALCRINGPPTNGSTSLRRNGVLDHFDWTLKQETHIHTILTWHIATCYCDMFPPAEESSSDREVATTLSGYCAYLVVFLPDLLAENTLITSMALQQVLGEAKEALGRRRRRLSMEAKLRRIQEVELPEDGAAGLRDLTTFRKGVRLGRQLEQQQPDALARWKVMADFWAETILYVAPSDNGVAHIERLARGGEFVTHLWALLSNDGIHKRAMEQQLASPSATDHAQAGAGREPEDLTNSRETRRVLRNRRKPNPRVTGPEWVN